MSPTSTIYNKNPLNYSYINDLKVSTIHIDVADDDYWC